MFNGRTHPRQRECRAGGFAMSSRFWCFPAPRRLRGGCAVPMSARCREDCAHMIWRCESRHAGDRHLGPCPWSRVLNCSSRCHGSSHSAEGLQSPVMLWEPACRRQAPLALPMVLGAGLLQSLPWQIQQRGSDELASHAICGSRHAGDRRLWASGRQFPVATICRRGSIQPPTARRSPAAHACGVNRSDPASDARCR